MRTKNIIIFFIILMLIKGGIAQPELKIVGNIQSGNGLLTGGIKYIYKDSEGFMWFTFERGFQRWDGYTAKNYGYLTDTTLNSAYRFCRPILEDQDGNFFIGTLKNGLIKLDRKTDRYIRYHHDPAHPENSLPGHGVISMLPDTNGDIWLGSYEGLTRFNPRAESFKNYVVNPDETYDPRNITRCIFRDSEGTLWIGTQNGLYLFNEENECLEKIITDPVLPENLNFFGSVLEDIHGSLWFGTNWGILVYDKAGGFWKHIMTINPDKPDSYADAKVNCMLEYHSRTKHQVWIGTMAGLKVYDMANGELTHFTPSNGYPEITNAGSVQFLFRDENDILWASMAGITLIDLKRNPFQNIRLMSYPDSMYDERAQCFFEDGQNNIWIGSENNGIYKFNQKLEFLNNYKACNLPERISEKEFNNHVWRIYEDPSGRIWMNTGPTFLSVFDIKSGNFQPVEVDVGSYTPKALIIDAFGMTWLTAHDGLFSGTVTGNHELQVSLLDNPGLPRVPMDEILYDTHGRLWLITRASGVFCLHPDNRDSMKFSRYLHKNYRHKFTIEYNARKMTEDPEGNIWFISHRELFRYDPALDSIVPDEFFNNQYNGELNSVIRDKNGIFWMGIAVGMLAYNYCDTAFGGFRKIDYRSGMPFTFLTRSNFFIDSRGYIYQGGQLTTERGFFRFHPDSIPEAYHNPLPVVLTNFQVRNKDFMLDSNITYKKAIRLKHKENFFSFEFSAMDYRGPEKNQYAYMLEGMDDDWVYTGNRRFANYTGIAPGDYVFRVKASNTDGYWNEEGTSIKLSILPPPWKSWWAYSLYGIAFFTLLIGWRRYDLKRQKLKQALEIEQVEAEKLKELDSMKSRFFANISHEFRTPLTLILGPLEKLISTTNDKDCINDLNMMQRNARRLQRLINQLLNLSKLEAGEMKLIAGERNIVSLVRGYVHSFESLARQKNISLKFNSDDERTLIYVDNDKIEKILYNLLSNAFKFTPEGGEISVSVLTHPVGPYYKENTTEGVKIIVADTGPGIPPDKVKFVFNRFYQTDNASLGDQEGTGIGLALTQELVKLHHGDITVKSHEGKGTTFIVTLPKGYEHLKPEEISAVPKAGDADEEGLKEFEFDNIPVRVEKSPNPEIREADDGRPLLLIVEDNDDLRTYVRSYLDKEYLVNEATDGAQGLQMAIEYIPDLIISDVMMPEIDGYQLCSTLKTDERTSHIPVILLTAKAALEDKLEGLGLGADDFLSKPFDPAELISRIRNLIAQRQKLQKKFLKEFSLYHIPQAAEELSMDEHFMLKAVQLVKEHIPDPGFTVERFGNGLAMSRMQLHRKITALTGQTAGEFIRNLRLQEAAKLLSQKTGTVAEIAYDTGFTSPSYFTKCFKEYFGMSPTEYQRTSYP